MKKLFLFLLTVVLSVSALAQTRKVAILETVDRQNQITYGVKLMLRSYLAEAITNSKGYEAYVRTEDIRAIIDEQEFQRTGYVSDEEIKKIGQMTGVQYILVVEASKIDDQNLFVSAKILNVETARMEMTSNLMVQSDVQSLQQGAKDLASRLLKEDSTPAVVSKSFVSPGYIERVTYNEYKIGDQWMNRKEYYNFINNKNCIPAYQQFQTGKKCVTAGWVTFGSGLTIMTIGLCCLAADQHYYNGSYYEHDYSGSIACCVLAPIGGATAVCAGIPLLSVGYYKMNNAYKKYNEYCSPDKKPSYVSFNLQSSANGLGLAIHF